jgi:hypothetical protein
VSAVRQRRGSAFVWKNVAPESLIGDKARGQVNPIIFLALASTGDQCYRTLQDALERLKIDPEGADIVYKATSVLSTGSTCLFELCYWQGYSPITAWGHFTESIF